MDNSIWDRFRNTLAYAAAGYTYPQRPKNTVPDSAPPRGMNALREYSSRDMFLASRNTDWAEKYGGVVPYYPQQRYFDENLGPELGITGEQLNALAKANVIATKNNLLSPAMANRMLPTLLVEGASGVRGWGYPDTEPYRAILRKAGLPDNLSKIREMWTAENSSEMQAKLMHAMMAAKVMNYGEDLAVERWNGKGTAKGGYADAKNHARKVAELESLLPNPKNAEMMRYWNNALDQSK